MVAVEQPYLPCHTHLIWVFSYFIKQSLLEKGMREKKDDCPVAFSCNDFMNNFQQFTRVIEKVRAKGRRKVTRFAGQHYVSVNVTFAYGFNYVLGHNGFLFTCSDSLISTLFFLSRLRVLTGTVSFLFI